MDGSPESAVGATQQANAETAQAVPPTGVVEQPKVEKGPGIFKKAWMTIRGQNHLEPSALHEDLAAQKTAASEQTIAEMTHDQGIGAPVGEKAPDSGSPSEIAPTTATPTEQPTATKGDELTPIGVPAPTNPNEAGKPAGSVDEMISELEEKVKEDEAEAEEKETPAEDSATIALEASKKEDTAEALDAVAANMAKMPEASGVSSPVGEPESTVEESEAKPANVVDMTTRTGVTSVAPNPTEPPTETGNMTILRPEKAPEATQGTGAMDAGSGSQFESNKPEPVQEAAIGIRNAVDASNASDQADSDLAASAQKQIDSDEAKAQRDAMQQPLSNEAPATETPKPDQAAA